jgi:heme/copper-type cytochrome/quinol oxidase subunit 1
VTTPPERQPRLLAFYWVLGATIIWLASPRPKGLLPETVPGETYYVMVRGHYAFSLSAGLLIFAAIYLFLDTIDRRRYRRGLGLVHLGLTFVGSLLILSPSVALGLIGTPRRYVDPMTVMTTANAIMDIGYVMTFIGLMVFVVMLIEALIRQIFAAPASVR